MELLLEEARQQRTLNPLRWVPDVRHALAAEMRPREMGQAPNSCRLAIRTLQAQYHPPSPNKKKVACQNRAPVTTLKTELYMSMLYDARIKISAFYLYDKLCGKKIASATEPLRM